jgi:ubiquitin carboxyl-terminal hydrolase 8
MEKGFSGLVNLGNTCYLNATLQILSHIHELNNYIKGNTTVTNSNDSILIREWYDLYNVMWSKNCTISPNKFLYNVRELSKIKNSIFHEEIQHDSVEYFYFCIDSLHNSYNLLNPIVLVKTSHKNINDAIDLYESKNKSIIHYLFTSFLLVEYSNAKTYEFEFEKIEPSFTIELSIPTIQNPTINDCFEETFKLEIMPDIWFDDKSNTNKQIMKQTYICYAPDILVIHLKRWDYNFNKNETTVHFDETINIHKYTKCVNESACNYELFGIINHHGNAMNGHYFSYIKKGKWYIFDDTTIQPINKSVNDNKNYCLFYRKIK